MTLTDAQRETIRYFGLEVVNERECKVGDWILNGGGNLYVATHASTLTSVVVVRPAHAAKVAGLERYINQLETATSSVGDTNSRLHKQVAALESELAPIRAMKVGSAEWAMVQDLMGRKVVARHGRNYTVQVQNQDHVEPFTLLPAPEPEPSAAELAAAIDAWANCESRDWRDKFDAMIALASRVKRQESGDGR